jgi:hypothetical protein
MPQRATLNPPASFMSPEADLDTVEAQQLKPNSSPSAGSGGRKSAVKLTASAPANGGELQEALAWAEANPQTFEELVVGLATPRAIARWQQRRGTCQGLAVHRPSLLQRPAVPPSGGQGNNGSNKTSGGLLALTPPTTVAASRVSLLLYSAKNRPGATSAAQGSLLVPEDPGCASTEASKGKGRATASPQLSQGALARAVAAMDSRSDAVLPLLLPLCGAITLHTAVQRIVDDVSILFGSGHCQLFIAQDMGPALPPRLLLMNPKPCNVKYLSFDFGTVGA